MKTMMMNTVVEFLEARELKFARDGEDALRTGFAGQTGTFEMTIRVIDNPRILAAVTLCPIPVPPDVRPAVAEFIDRANDGMVPGHLVIDWDNGIVKHQAALIVAGRDASSCLSSRARCLL